MSKVQYMCGADLWLSGYYLQMQACFLLRLWREVHYQPCIYLQISSCKVPWHSGYRCDDETGVMRDRNDVLFGKLVEKKRWQKCPQCNQCVELVSGCAIMTCRCKTFFCYMCGSRFTLLHAFTCKKIRFWCF
ncbi:E3 ubiquitin-protein ligase RSL1-like [Magnolia sinica]|uniref:E3 ubiquitin-protein ligase RSL1-like n=1 Tax=Magnolia sinica TaxID=86752 RepID=UPI002658AFBF|nr:E3 ubiquitin-protein ligase RSL1-like [Magnolia sinica]